MVVDAGQVGDVPAPPSTAVEGNWILRRQPRRRQAGAVLTCPGLLLRGR